MADIHIDEFFQDCARAILKLYSHFPRQDALYVDELSGAFERDEYGIPSARHKAAFDCMLWLGHEGHIRYSESINQDGIEQAVLSQRAFIALNSPALCPIEKQQDLPPSVSLQQLSLAHQLRLALQHKQPVAVREMVLQFLQH